MTLIKGASTRNYTGAITTDEFRALYRDSIRAHIDIDKLPVKIRSKQFDLESLASVYVCNTITKGSARFSGDYLQLEDAVIELREEENESKLKDYEKYGDIFKDCFCVFRFPAVRVNGKYLLLDGNHRAVYMIHNDIRAHVTLDYFDYEQGLSLDGALFYNFLNDKRNRKRVHKSKA